MKGALGLIPNLEQMKEPEARLKIQEIIDEHGLKGTVLINANVVWSKKRILKNLGRIMKHGTLYLRRSPRYVPVGSMLRFPQGGIPVLSKYFYEFLHLTCGSTAHYNIHGWICHYPTVDYLKKFFEKNEFGKRVIDWIPDWYADAKRIVEEIERKLFPWQTFMQMRAKEKSDK